ncbi:MAG: STAS domain-containing protein [Gammaproteobacteria bacterium]|nr:STAS domain-containing protein [Gammaproteobacteria bacterium]
MQCEVRKEATFDVVSLKGEVDLSTSPAVRQAILASLEAGTPVAIELQDVTYIDSSGVASLVEGYQTAKSRGLLFTLVGASESVMGVLELARLDKVFPIAETLGELTADGG